MAAVGLYSNNEDGLTKGSLEPGRLQRHNAVSHRLDLRDVSLTVDTWSGSWWTGGCCRRSPKTILDTLDLTVKSGQILALLGNSGSGKTTLLDVISGRHSGRLAGTVTLDGKPLTTDAFRGKGGYVIQADRLLANLTVRETLAYIAHLKFKGRLTATQIGDKISRCLRQMSLVHVQNSLVGDMLTRGISGGEKRRLSVATQLLQDPSVLLLDEPTTGLDSFTAHYLVETLANLAHAEDKIVVLTIHQPRSDIFRCLDTVGILSTGRMVYFGPQSSLVSYFTALSYPCPTFCNPLDFYIDIASVDRRSDKRETASSERVGSLVQSYRESTLYKDMVKEAEVLSVSDSDNNGTIWRTTGADCREVVVTCPIVASPNDKKQTRKEKRERHKIKRRINAIRSFGAVGTNCRRMHLNLWRNKTHFLTRLICLPLFATFLWLFCWQLDNSLSGIQDRLGLFYQSTAVSCTVGVLLAAGFFELLRNLCNRETCDGLYSSGHFVVAYYLHIIPFQIVSSLLFATWIHWGLGMYPDVYRFLRHAAVCFIQQHIGEIQTMGSMALITDPRVAQAIGTLLVSLSVLYASGFLKSMESLNVVLRYLAYINHFKYAGEIIAANELVGLEFDCSDKFAPNCTLPGEVVLEEILPGSADNIPRNFGILVAMVFGYWVAGILAFMIRGRRVLR